MLFARYVCLITMVTLGGTAGAGLFHSVDVNPPTINPSLGDFVTVTIAIERSGTVTVQIVDRDGFLVRTLAQASALPAGKHEFRWDGRNDHGEVVADEAYSLRAEWTNGTERETFFPADGPSLPMTTVDPEYYSDRTATLRYSLPVASRIHLQTGLARRNPKSGRMEGPVMKTVVNREPRPAGPIAEAWNGFDENGTVKVADMPDFVIAIAATPLPQTSIITYGNRTTTFAQAALTRGGRSLFTSRSATHAHHAGLSVLEDVSPSLRIEPVNATWSHAYGRWSVRGPTLRLRLSLHGPSAMTFAKQPGQIFHFLNGVLVSQSRRPESYPIEVEVSLLDKPQPQMVSINWRSEFGAVAANTIRVAIDHDETQTLQRRGTNE